MLKSEKISVIQADRLVYRNATGVSLVWMGLCSDNGTFIRDCDGFKAVALVPGKSLVVWAQAIDSYFVSVVSNAFFDAFTHSEGFGWIEVTLKHAFMVSISIAFKQPCKPASGFVAGHVKCDNDEHV
jgi:hypothetical protein